jgi:hypothetical protein
MMDDSFNPTFHTADVDVGFDFIRAQTCHPADNNYWILDEQAEEINADGGDFPSATDWEDDAPDVLSIQKYQLIRLDGTYGNKQGRK